jgi:membrane-bound ClpP family serine protease
VPHTATEFNAQWPRNPQVKEDVMIALGIVLIILGLVFPTVHILFSIGVVLLVIGAVLWALGSMGRPVYGRRHYY